MLVNKFNAAVFVTFLIAPGQSAPIPGTDDEARTISPSGNRDLCLQLRAHRFLDNNYVNYLTLWVAYHRTVWKKMAYAPHIFSRPCRTREPDQEQFYFDDGVKSRLQMINSTSRAAYSLATSPHADEAYLITDPAGQWSNFEVEKGQRQFAGDVRIRNAFNNKCLTSKGNEDPVFSKCEELSADQVCSSFLVILREKTLTVGFCAPSFSPSAVRSQLGLPQDTSSPQVDAIYACSCVTTIIWTTTWQTSSSCEFHCLSLRRALSSYVPCISVALADCDHPIMSNSTPILVLKAVFGW